MTTRWLWVPLLLAMACGDDDGDDSTDTIPREDGSAPLRDLGTAGDLGMASDLGTESDLGEPTPTADCFTFADGILVFEAESIPIDEMWEIGTAESGFNGSGYIEWTGESHNNDPTNGVIDLTLRVPEAGRYQLTWRTRIGMGDNTTEHNDTWVTFPDADDYYGLKGTADAEIRRYPKPICDDGAAMDAIMAMDQVDTADCVRGSTTGGWLKVYSSGANDWRWSARTSDSDASTVTIEFDDAGDYTMRLAARADHSLLDRVVLYREGISSDAREDLSLPETRCE
jgi:hypothetical protein